MSSVLTAATSLGLCSLMILLMPLALIGLALINTGLGRARSSAYAILSSITVAATAVIVFSLWGFSRVEVPGSSAHSLMIGGASWDWMARGPLLLHGMNWNGFPALSLLFQLFAVSFAALIPVGAGAERWRFSACLLSTVFFAAFTYPFFAHWAWGGGWLAQLGTHFGLGHGFVDAGGSGVIQVTGGLTALSIAWILGPRRGRYTADGMASAIPGHNIVLALFGCLLMTPGWIGLNSAGAVLFAGAAPSQIILIAVNTLLCACAALFAAVLVTRLRFGKPDASLSANGWVGGLVASSAASPFLTPAAAFVVGLVAGLLVGAFVELLEVRLSLDDPGGSISVHVIAGIWGLLAAGMFARIPLSDSLPYRAQANSGQMLAQLIGVATLLGFILPLTFGMNWLLDRAWPQRVEPEGERIGMDLHQLGAGAYPDFPVYSDESRRR